MIRLAAAALGVALLLLWCHRLVAAVDSATAVAVWDQATLVDLLAPPLAQHLGLEPSREFGVVDGQEVILLTRDGSLFDLSQQHALPATAPLRIDSFTVSAGLLVTIRGDRVGWYEDGEVKERIRLPSSDMRIVAGPHERLYVYGPRGDGSIIYLLQAGGVTPLLEIPRGRLSALTVIGERVLFAIENVIYTAARGERVGLLFVATGGLPIRSLAADPVAGLLYFSAGETVYAMRAGTAISILRGLAGYLRYSRDALYVLDPDRRRLVKILGLEKLTIDTGRAPTVPSPPGAFKD